MKGREIDRTKKDFETKDREIGTDNEERARDKMNITRR